MDEVFHEKTFEEKVMLVVLTVLSFLAVTSNVAAIIKISQKRYCLASHTLLRNIILLSICCSNCLAGLTEIGRFFVNICLGNRVSEQWRSFAECNFLFSVISAFLHVTMLIVHHFIRAKRSPGALAFALVFISITAIWVVSLCPSVLTVDSLVLNISVTVVMFISNIYLLTSVVFISKSRPEKSLRTSDRFIVRNNMQLWKHQRQVRDISHVVIATTVSYLLGSFPSWIYLLINSVRSGLTYQGEMLFKYCAFICIVLKFTIDGAVYVFYNRQIKRKSTTKYILTESDKCGTLGRRI